MSDTSRVVTVHVDVDGFQSVREAEDHVARVLMADGCVLGVASGTPDEDNFERTSSASIHGASHYKQGGPKSGHTGPIPLRPDVALNPSGATHFHIVGCACEERPRVPDEDEREGVA